MAFLERGTHLSDQELAFRRLYRAWAPERKTCWHLRGRASRRSQGMRSTEVGGSAYAVLNSYLTECVATQTFDSSISFYHGADRGWHKDIVADVVDGCGAIECKSTLLHFDTAVAAWGTEFRDSWRSYSQEVLDLAIGELNWPAFWPSSLNRLSLSDRELRWIWDEAIETSFDAERFISIEKAISAFFARVVEVVRLAVQRSLPQGFDRSLGSTTRERVFAFDLRTGNPPPASASFKSNEVKQIGPRGWNQGGKLSWIVSQAGAQDRRMRPASRAVFLSTSRDVLTG